MTAFEKLTVWQFGLSWVADIYRLSHRFPRNEQFGLTSQIRKVATSTLANLAEGCSRYTFADKAAKFVIARGECGEVKAFLLIASKLRYVQNHDIVPLLKMQEEISRMLSGLIASCTKRCP